MISSVEVRACTAPTDAPEGDGTQDWDSTTMVLVQVRARDTVGTVRNRQPVSIRRSLRSFRRLMTAATGIGTTCG